MFSYKNKHSKLSSPQSGNIFMAMFAAIAVVGAVGAGTVTLLKGPVSGMVALNKNNITEMRMEIAGKLVMAQAINGLAADGDTGTDYIEISPYETTSLTGGGTIPAAMNINDIDPWGSQIGYCSWDNGSVSTTAKNDAGTGTANRLKGQNISTSELIALVSPGPNRVFESGCYAYGDAAPDGFVKPAGSDDIAIVYTYAQAIDAMGDWWAFRADSTDSETVLAADQNLDLRADVTMTGLLQFNASASGLVLATSPGTTCSTEQENQLFLDTSLTPPSIVICTGGTIEPIVSNSGGGSTAISVARIQSKATGTPADPVSVTLDLTPTQGNLLVVIAGNRRSSGANTISGSGWTQHVMFQAHSADTTNRRGLAVWSKIAGASEPTAITVDFGDGASNVLVQEFQILNGTPSIDVTATTQGGTTDVTSITSGTTSTTSTADSLSISAMVTRDTPGTTPTWSNSFGGDVAANDSTLNLYSAWKHNTTTGAMESTATWTTARDASAGIVVFKIDPISGGGSGAADCENAIGTLCDDDTVYAGTTPDSNANMYVTPCDLGMTWNGTTCSGSRSYLPWNNGNSAWQSTTVTNFITGDSNTAYLITDDSDINTGGVQPHQAAQACADLSYGGYSDWYLPSLFELNVMYLQKSAIGNFENNYYWSSTESDAGFSWAWAVSLADGDQANWWGKHEVSQSIRCARNDGTAPVSCMNNIGDICDDGSVYAGVSVDGYEPMFTTPCDAGMTYSAGTCTGTRAALSYNNGNSSGYTLAGVQNDIRGENNTNTLVTVDSNSVAGGVQPHQAAQYCYDLSAHGYNDWYLPAENELFTLYTFNSSIGNFDPGYYTSSTESPNAPNNAVLVQFSDGYIYWDGDNKPWTENIRCVRKGTPISTLSSINQSDFNFSAYAWGPDADQQLGNGSATTTLNVPAAITSSNGFVDISMGWGRACAIDGSGDVWCWGDDTEGKLGNGPSVTADQNVPYQVSNISDVVSISTGQYTTCAVQSDGTGLCWGNGALGGIGDGSNSIYDVPTLVSGVSNFVKISTREEHNCGLTADGLIYCWGKNSDGEVGDGTTTSNIFTPTLVTGGITDFVDVETGYDKSCGIRKNGDAYCWGSGSGLGVSETSFGPFRSPQLVLGGIKFSQLSIGSDHTCGIDLDGNAWCWGQNGNEQLGIGVNDGTYYTPQRVTGIKDFVQISAGRFYTCGVISDGKGYCWGWDQFDQFGNGAGTSSYNSPQLISNVQNFVKLSTSPDWGNERSTAGIVKSTTGGSETAPEAPYLIKETRPAGKVFDNHGLSISRNSGTDGQEAGIGFKVDATSTAAGDTLSAAITGVKMGGGTRAGLAFKTMNASNALTQKMLIDEDGDIAVSGVAATNVQATLQTGAYTNTWPSDYHYGLLVSDMPNTATDQIGYFGLDESTGNATILFSKDFYISSSDDTGSSLTNLAYFLVSNPIQILADFNQQKLAGEITVRAASATATDLPAIRFERSAGSVSSPSAISNGYIIGTMRFQGYDGTTLDADGQIQIEARVTGTVAAGSIPTSLHIKVDPTGVMDAIASRLTIDETGNVGIGIEDPLQKMHVAGRGAVDDGAKVGTDSDCSDAADEGTLRYNTGSWEYCDGSAWSPFSGAGANTPLRCEHAESVTNASMSELYSCASYTNGRVACWGRNTDYAVGDYINGTIYAYPKYVRKNDIGNIIDVATSEVEATCAVNDKGEVWCWGNGGYGSLGNGDYDTIPTPVKVSTNQFFVSVSGGFDHMCGLTNTGTVWCWGNNSSYGAVGTSVNATYTTPTSVSNIASAVQMDVGGGYGCAVLKNGTVKCWGLNDDGQLGNGTTTNNHIPQTVSSLTDVVHVSAGGYGGTAGVCATKRDGTVWCWGDEGATDINQGTGQQNAPRQITGITNALETFRSPHAACALINDGTVRCWGADWNGLIGSNFGGGSTTTPQTVSGITTAVKLAETGAHAYSICAILENGKMQCWGEDGDGQLADGTDGGVHSSPVDNINDFSCNAWKYVFATDDSTSFTGNLGGVEGADAICQRQADFANLPGVYYAWISDGVISPSSRFNKGAQGWYLQGPLKIADDWADLTDGTLDNVINANAFGSIENGSEATWTNVDTDGTPLGNDHCNQWTSSSGSVNGARGDDDDTDSNWTNENGVPVACNFSTVSIGLFCFQQ